MFRYPAEDGTLAVSVVDGSGDDREVSKLALLAAEVSVRVGARRGVVPGVLAATELAANAHVEFPKPDGVMVLAVVRPGQPVVVGHVGDCRAYGWSGGKLEQLTVDHTQGQRLRHEGASETEAASVDHVVGVSIARATVGTVALRECGDPIVVLTSDGVHRAISPQTIAAIVSENRADADACALALMDAARATGFHDDATAAVIIRPVPYRGDAWVDGR
jgi:protein phosphatase